MGFPVRVVTWLCLYYKIDITGISLWERVDRLVSADIFSKPGARNLKECLSTIMELYIRTGEKKIVSIAAAKRDYNQLNPPYDSDEDEEEDQQDVGNQTSFEAMEFQGAGSKTKKDKMYVLSASEVEQIAQCHCVLLPLAAALRDWLNEENRVNEKANLKGSNLMDESNCAMAEAYLRMCHYERAKFYFRTAIHEDPTNFTTLNAFGVMWNKLGNYAKAIKYYERAVVLIERARGADAPQLATQFNNLAMANVNLSRNLEAIGWLEKALRVDEKVYGESHSIVARDYRNIGLMALKEQQWKKAEDYLRRGLSIDSSIYGEVSPQVAAYHNDLARVFEGIQDYEKAAECYHKALEVDRQVYTDASPVMASHHQNLAALYLSQNEVDLSLEHFQHALDLFTTVHGDEHLTVAATMYKCGTILAQLDQLEKALDCLKNAYESFKKLKGATDAETIVAYKKMKEVEELLQGKLRYGDEYEKWKLMMEEKRRRAQEEQESSRGEMEVEDRDSSGDEGAPKLLKVYGPGSVQKCKKDVFEDQFFEL